jgi:acetyltransferase-like isoleucine patch superfamily enzyme
MIKLLAKAIRRLAALALLNIDPVAYARRIGVKIGKDLRIINPELQTFGSEPYLISIGSHVTLSSGVRLVTHDGGVAIFRTQNKDIERFGPIRIGDNVFVGMNSIIMPGVNIGDGSVIGAGSIVTRDVPPNCVVAGVPARRIKSTDQYWESVSSQCTYIRSLPAAKKRDYLEARFRQAESSSQEV